MVITDLVRPQSPGIPAPDRRRQGRIVHSPEAFHATEQFVPRNPRTPIDASHSGNNEPLQLFAPINNLGADQRADSEAAVTGVDDFVRAADDDRRGVRRRGGGELRGAQSRGVT